ncbi:hypothetical protein GTP38_23245 [Duganella sp. FT94W]|uniref:Uncharacterized protein n=1 Tax=Duganella lactea TaxID=2692173 RepID=A0ABW9VE06_9BURK|nr:hypothetical protein [Duganella lactea]MYM37246.1 hypothetical protein [Duganella lactea]
MSNFDLPRRGSSPYLALNALNNMGGEATVQAIMKVRNWQGREKPFQDEVISRLTRCLLVDVLGDMCVITNAGRKYLGVKVEEAGGFVGEPAGPRYMPAKTELNRSKHFPPRPLRPGADEYRSIPSVMAGQRVAFR